MKAEEIEIPMLSTHLTGNLVIPDKAIGIAVFSHGSGSSRLSPRNKLVAELMQRNKIGTLLFDLLTEEEDQNYENRFNIDLLVSRLIKVTEWLTKYKVSKGLPIVYFGASTGAASAMRAAAYFGKNIKAVVCRGGRPDLALNVLQIVTAPTLLIVGQMDIPVIKMNKKAFDQMLSIKEMKIIPGASHLFEEPGKLIEVAELAVIWYKKYLQNDSE